MNIDLTIRAARDGKQVRTLMRYCSMNLDFTNIAMIHVMDLVSDSFSC